LSIVLEVQDLNYRVDNLSILEDVSFSIQKGEYTAIIGPNGGGKTTLINTILGLNRGYSGSIKLFETPLQKFQEWSRIGYVPQRAVEIDRKFPITVYEVIKMGRFKSIKKFWRSRKEDLKIIDSVMAELKIETLKDRLIGELSGGQRQRVMIAKALVSEPELLFLDEPNSGVDGESQKDFYSILKKLNQEKGISILFITHDIGVIEDSITSIISINKRLQQSSNPEEVFNCQTMRAVYGIDSHLINHRH
jgi:zinc transport system ATP-binding protein